MIDLRQQVVIEARTWLGTDFRHQSRLKKSWEGPGGVDCLSLVWAVGEKVKAMAPVTKEQSAPFWAFYGRRPNPPVMHDCLAQFLVELPAGESPRVADLCWMHWGNEMPIHMAIIGEATDGRQTLIHSVWDMGVIEHGFTDVFRERVTSYWRYPGIVAAEAEAA